MSVRKIDIVAGTVLWGAAEQTSSSDLALATLLATYALGRILGHADSRLTRGLAVMTVLWLMALPSNLGPDPGPLCVLGIIVTWWLRRDDAQRTQPPCRSPLSQTDAGDPVRSLDTGTRDHGVRAAEFGNSATGAGSSPTGIRHAL